MANECLQLRAAVRLLVGDAGWRAWPLRRSSSPQLGPGASAGLPRSPEARNVWRDEQTTASGPERSGGFMRWVVLAFMAVAGCGGEAALLRDMAIRDVDPPVPVGCMSGNQDGYETDVDCGGWECSPCAAGKRCNRGLDCLSTICTMYLCAAPDCTDGAKNGTETDEDCGGGCVGCALGKTCKAGSDCASMICTSGQCVSATHCMNKKQDETETDIDCGGGACPTCGDGQACWQGPDCKSGTCIKNVCHSRLVCMGGTADCDGDVANGCEVDTNADPRNCGGCGRSCGAGATKCVGGTCKP